MTVNNDINDDSATKHGDSWIGCSGSECRYWLEVPQLFECQDDLPESR